MSNEELMKVRYKVIADYPLTPYKIGDLVTLSGETSVYRSFHLITIPCEDNLGYEYKNPKWELIEYAETHPHLFKKLSWWEDRKPEDMPEYVKSKYDGKIHFVERWEHLVFWTCKTEDDREFMQDDILPATQFEYENQTKR